MNHDEELTDFGIREIVINSIDDAIQLFMAMQTGGQFILASSSSIGLEDKNARRLTFIRKDVMEPPTSEGAVGLALAALNETEECFQPETLEELREHFGTIRAALTAQQPDVPNWLKTLDYQRDLALIWMVAKGSKDYDDTIGDRIQRVQQLILEQKQAIDRAAMQSKPDVNQELLKALKKADYIFRDYERIHLSKSPPDRAKAKDNGEYAYEIEQAIAKAEGNV